MYHITPVRPYYPEWRLEHTRRRLDKIPIEYKEKKVLIFGDAERIESNYLIGRGFTKVISTDFEFPQEGQTYQNIEGECGIKADIVWTSHVLEHCYSPFRAAVNVRDVLPHGGEFFVYVPSEEWGWHEPYHIYSLTLKGWSELFKRARFRTIQMEETPNGERTEYFYRLEKV